MNWALMIVTSPFDNFSIGDRGVFKTSISPGVMDCLNGVMYILNEDIIIGPDRKRSFLLTNPIAVGDFILEYYKPKQVKC